MDYDKIWGEDKNCFNRRKRKKIVIRKKERKGTKNTYPFVDDKTAFMTSLCFFSWFYERLMKKKNNNGKKGPSFPLLGATQRLIFLPQAI